MYGIRRRLVLGLVLCAALAPAAAPAMAGSPGARAVVEKTVADVLAVLKQRQLPSAKRRAQVQEIAYSVFDFETMSRLVLARGWRDLSPEQQRAFQEAFKTFLARSYGTRLDSYKQEQVEVVGEREEPRGDVTVRTRIVGGDFEGADVDYRMRKRADGWRVIDVVIEGISLVGNYRDQFREVLKREGADELIGQLRTKNAEPIGS